jgi:hypothetical protein
VLDSFIRILGVNAPTVDSIIEAVDRAAKRAAGGD